MFTGIIEEVGTIKSIKRSGGGMKVEISAPKSVKELRISDSVAINGVCQTVISKSSSTLTVEAVEETLKKTAMKALETGVKVNVELPLRFNDRMGGHMVLGHVDAVGKIAKITKKKSSWIVTLTYPVEFAKYIIPEGSIAVDGVSLTVASCTRKEIILSIIPHTWINTIIFLYKPGSFVNLEFDVIGKYIEGLLKGKGESSQKRGRVTEDGLRRLGF